jgi:hypothetical protein
MAWALGADVRNVGVSAEDTETETEIAVTMVATGVMTEIETEIAAIEAATEGMTEIETEIETETGTGTEAVIVVIAPETAADPDLDLPHATAVKVFSARLGCMVIMLGRIVMLLYALRLRPGRELN